MSAVAGDQYFSKWDSVSIIVVTTAAISVYNSFELLLMISARFREWRSLLFISLVISSAGVLPYFTGFLLEYFRVTYFWAAMLLSTLGWIALVTGQAVVLYSRLGLVLNDVRILRFIKYLIIINSTIMHTVTTVVQYGKTYGGEKVAFGKALYYVEKTQMTAFTLVEFIISGIYLWKTSELLRVIKKPGTRKVMIELFIINVIIVLGDIALLVLEYSGRRVMERTWKGLIYSVKLKLEFAILSKLVDLVQSSQRTLSNALADVNTFVDVTKTTSNVRPADITSARRRSPNSDMMPDWISKLEQRNIQTLHLEDVDQQREQSPDPFITRKEV